MTPLMRWLKKQWETHLGTWEEGPEPPERLRKMAEVFAAANPRASVGDWVEFAALHAGSAYQQGYARGYERTERIGPEWEHPDEAAAALARMEGDVEGDAPPYDPALVVPLDGVPQEAAAATAIAMSQEWHASQGQRRGPARR